MKPFSTKKPEKRTEDFPGPLGTRWKLSRFSHGSPDSGCAQASNHWNQNLINKSTAVVWFVNMVMWVFASGKDPQTQAVLRQATTGNMI